MRRQYAISLFLFILLPDHLLASCSIVFYIQRGLIHLSSTCLTFAQWYFKIFDFSFSRNEDFAVGNDIFKYNCDILDCENGRDHVVDVDFPISGTSRGGAVSCFWKLCLFLFFRANANKEVQLYCEVLSHVSVSPFCLRRCTHSIPPDSTFLWLFYFSLWIFDDIYNFNNV